MPAPNRRNKGEALAHQISDHSAARGVADDRDRLVATRARQDKKWAEAVSTLEQRADQVRHDYERGRQFGRFDNDVRKGRAKPPVIVLTPAAHPRYWLGLCLDCNRELWVHSPKPRVPLCTRCWKKRA